MRPDTRPAGGDAAKLDELARVHWGDDRAGEAAYRRGHGGGEAARESGEGVETEVNGGVELEHDFKSYVLFCKAVL